jgi:1,4-dihydroxy-2-naphthoate octaprenyltransferase
LTWDGRAEAGRIAASAVPETRTVLETLGREGGMAETAQDRSLAEESREDDRGLLYLAGVRYWSASLLPALVGTTLPIWLRPAGFSFQWLNALEFLLATVLLHAGFSFLHAILGNRLTARWPAYRHLGTAGVLLTAACLLGMHLSSSVPPHDSVPTYIFVVYGLTTLFAGVLYVVPPFSFSQRVGGEVILAEGLGMIPVLGAYLVQVGDLNRTVYLASMPLVVATGLWVWADELITLEADQNEGRRTMVALFGARFSGRIVTLALSLLFCASLVLAVASASLNPMVLIVAVLAGLVWKIVAVSWDGYADNALMVNVRMNASVLHFATGIMIAMSSLATLLS